MNAQHRTNRRNNRARRLSAHLARLAADAKDNASQPVTVARIESEMVGVRRALSQYVA